MGILVFFVVLAAVAAVLCSVLAQMTLWQSLLIGLAVFLGIHIIYILFFYLRALCIDNTKPLEKQSKICRFGCATIIGLACAYMGIRTHIKNEELLPTDGRFLLISNHRSNCDPLVIMDKLRKYNISFVSKPSNMKIPFAGRIAYGAGFIPIDRENNRNALKSILQAAYYLKKDMCSMCIYPEGTRSKKCELLPFHAGSFKIAQKAEIPLVIASTRGTEKLSKFRLFRGNHVYVDILEVIPAEKVKATSTAELAEYSRNLIDESLKKAEG